MSKLEKLKDKAKGLEAKDPKGAIEAWLSVLQAQEEEGEPNPDLSVFNRVGDLYLKVKDPAQAADYYDRAVDKYAELGFHNNAIAMCNKVLRNAPGRQTTYLKLAKLYAAKGFIAEAKQNFVEYAERMQKVGKIQQAFAALKEFTDISPENTQLRGMLEEHLKMYGDAERRPSSRAAAPAPPAAPPEQPEDLSKSGRRKTSSLVFLDVDAPPGARSSSSRCWNTKARSSRRPRPRLHRPTSRRCPPPRRAARAWERHRVSGVPNRPARRCTRGLPNRPRSSRSCRSDRRPRRRRLPPQSAPRGKQWWRYRRSSSSPTSIPRARRRATTWMISRSRSRISHPPGDSSRPRKTHPSRRRGG